MAPPKSDPITDEDVQEAALFFLELARRWIRRPGHRTAEMERVLSAVVVAARRERGAQAREMEFVVALTKEVAAHYEEVRGPTPPDDDSRDNDLGLLLRRYQLPSTAYDREELDMDAEEVSEERGPVEAARTNVGRMLGVSGTTIRNYIDRLRAAHGSLAESFEHEEYPALASFRWRRALWAARAVHGLLTRELDVSAYEVRRAMIAVLRRRKGPTGLL